MGTLTPTSTLQKIEKLWKNMSTWLAENPEMLEAALEIVESWDQGAFLFESPLFTPAGSSDSDEDDDISVSSTTTSRSSSGVDSPPRLPSLVVKPSKIEARSARRLKPSTLTSTHHRRREEIKSLQTMSTELERQLNSLQNRAHGDGKTHEDQSSVWRDIAHRQQQLRSLAEAKQLSLRRRLDAQRRIEHGLVRLLQRARAMENDPWIRSIRYPGVVAGKINITDLDQLLRVDKASENMDTFFADPRFHDGTIPFVDTEVLEDQPGQFVIEMSQAWTVPFEVNRTMEALWKCCYIRQQEKWCSKDVTWDCATRVDTMALVADFSAMANIGSTKGYFDGRVVVKRFHGSDSTPPAIISDFFCAPNRNSPGSFAGVHAEEQSCMRVLPAMATTTNGEHTTWQGSHVQFTQRFTISFADGDLTGRHRAAHFTNTMVGNMRDCTELMHGNLESMLLTSR